MGKEHAVDQRVLVSELRWSGKAPLITGIQTQSKRRTVLCLAWGIRYATLLALGLP